MTRRRRPAQRPSPDPERRTLEIVEVGARGDGAAAGPVFVPYTLPGETVDALVSGERGDLVTVVEPSPDRSAPECPHFGDCGGCALQHWSRTAYQAWKRDRVVQALRRAGIAAATAPLVDATASGRRRAVFHAVRAKSVGFVFGFARARAAEIAPVETCAVMAPAIRDQLEALRGFAERISVRSGRYDIAVLACDAGLDVAVSGPVRLDPELIGDAADHARRHGWARITVGGELAAQIAPARVTMGPVSVEPPAAGFVQATQDAEDLMGVMAVDALSGCSRVVDLFAGVGAFAWRLAEHASVHAVEGDERAVAALKAVAPPPGLKPVTGQRRDLARHPMGRPELRGVDAVVLDPPRVGALAQAEALGGSPVSTCVYASCNPATFARDAAVLLDAGFALDTVTPIDQFLWSAHVELMGVFRR